MRGVRKVLLSSPKAFGVALQSHCFIVKTHDSTRDVVDHGWVAQSAEQWTENPKLAPRNKFTPSHIREHE